MAKTFGVYLFYMTVSSAPFLWAAYYLNSTSGKQFVDFGFFGLASLLGGLVCIYGVNCLIAYLAYCKEQQHERQRIQDELDNKLKEADDERKNRKLEAELAKAVIELNMKKEKQDHEIKVNDAIEMSKLKIGERRAEEEAASEQKKVEYKALGDVVASALNSRLEMPSQNNLS